MYFLGVCDDDPLELERLESYLLTLRDHGMPVDIRLFQNGYHLITAHKDKPFHLIFLDMLMEPISGLETARLIRQFDPLVNIIFITITAEYAVKGYSVEALRYVLKPVDKDKLIEMTIPILQKSKQFHEKVFTFSTAEGAEKLKLAEILYFESSLRKIVIHTLDGTREFYGTLNAIEKELDDKFFMRTHRSLVVNLRYIKQLRSTNLTLDNNEVLPVSKRRYRDIMERFLELSSDS